MFTRKERAEVIATLAQKFDGAKGIYMVDFNNINVEKITQLRAELRKNGVQYIVVKNTLARIALERCGLGGLTPYLIGPTGIAVTKTDSISPAKVFKEFKKKNINLLALKAAYVDGSLFKSDEALKLADLPGREVLLSQLLSCMSAPLSNFVGTLGSPLSKLALVLETLKNKKEKGETEKQL
jgi:large subunit ribosomal protein L10